MFGPLNVLSQKNLEHARPIELQEAWERRDFATTWKLTRILTGKRIGPKKNAVLPFHRLHHFVNRNGRHILRDQAVKEAALLHLWTYLKQNMYQQQRLHQRSTLGTSYRTTYSDMFGKSTFSQSSPSVVFSWRTMAIVGRFRCD